MRFDGVNRAKENAYFGILVCRRNGTLPPAVRSFYRRLALLGRRLGVTVLVFAPEWTDRWMRNVYAYAYDPERSAWFRDWFPFPRLIYDRSFFRTGEERRKHRRFLEKLARLPGVTLLGLGLGGKLEVYRHLQNAGAFAAVLPETEPYTGPGTLRRWLEKYDAVMLKPQNGMQGKLVFHLRRLSGERYAAWGRSPANRPVGLRFPDLGSLLRWADRRLTAGRPFLIQKRLSLTTRNGEPFDIRALVQKDGRGQWSFTGAAARIGPAGAPTSNLHGGGRAEEAGTFLANLFGEPAATDILGTIRETALAVPPALELRHGPLVELGIDFGVEPDGRIWLLEVNSKPGRTSFLQFPDKSVKIAAVASPIRYARYIFDRHLGGRHDESDDNQDPFHE